MSELAAETGDTGGRPELLAAWWHRGRWSGVNDEGNDITSRRHDDLVETLNDLADEGGVGQMLPPPPITRKASQYVRRLRRRAATERTSRPEQTTNEGTKS